MGERGRGRDSNKAATHLKRHRNLAQPSIIPRRRLADGRAGIRKNHGAGVFKAARGEGALQKQGLGAGVPAQAGVAAVVQGPEGGHDDGLRALGDERAEGLREG